RDRNVTGVQTCALPIAARGQRQQARRGAGRPRSPTSVLMTPATRNRAKDVTPPTAEAAGFPRHLCGVVEGRPGPEDVRRPDHVGVLGERALNAPERLLRGADLRGAVPVVAARVGGAVGGY